MIRDALQQIVASAVASLVDSGQLPEAVRSVRIEITDTKQPEHGDYACNFALTASKAAGMNPRQLGEMLAEGIRELGKEEIREIELAGPGFLNLRLNPNWVASFVPVVLALGETLPIKQSSNQATQQSINVEFVSVNPNGPITIGSGRGAAYGSTLCNVLEAAGNRVHREYYINDGVNSEQMRLFAYSVQQYLAGRIHWIGDQYDEHDLAWTLIDEFNQGLGTGKGGWLPSDFVEPFHQFLEAKALDASSHGVAVITKILSESRNVEDPHPWVDTVKARYESSWVTGEFVPYELVLENLGYRGEYVLEVAKQIILTTDLKTRLVHSMSNQGLSWVQTKSQAHMLEMQEQALQSFGTTFDTWFSEQSLHDSGEVAKEIDKMVASGVADDQEFRTVLKLARGGVIEDVEKQDQAGKVEEDDAPGTADLQIGEQAGNDLLAGKENTSSGADLEIGGPSGESSNPAIQQSSNSKTLWLRSTKFGDDMDRVLKRRDGRLTYIASDVAYHKDKLTDASGTRGTGPVDKMITILGPDHHGYIGRLQAVVAAMLVAESGVSALRHNGSEMPERRNAETPPLSDIEAKLYSSPEERDTCQAALAEAREKLEVQIYQLVRFMKDGKPAPMRKRDGNIYALIDLMREIGENVKPNGTEEEKLEVGKDVARFFYLMRSHDTTFDFDLDLAQKQSDENPVFYVQYAHARICSVIGKAGESGISALRHDGVTGDPAAKPQCRNAETPGTGLLIHDKELALIKKICDLPFEVQRCAEDYGVHRLTTYAIELARTYHHFYDACRVIQPDQPELSQARLALCEATRLALKGTLNLLGISAPERM